MLTSLPQKISNKGIALYFIALTIVSIIFISHAIKFEYMVLGIVEVVSFFVFSFRFSNEWKKIPEKRFVKNIFWWSLSIRIVWATISYYYYLAQTGMPFEFAAADSHAYHSESEWLSREKWSLAIDYLYRYRTGISDSGYNTYLTLIYKIFGPKIFLARIIKCFVGAFTGVLLYRLTARSINETTARIAAIFYIFMPNLIFYCGLHLKEIEMIFLIVAFLERTDYLLRSRKYNIITIALPALLALSLFTFRTVIGATAIFSFATSIVFTSTNIVGRKKRTMLIVWSMLAISLLGGGTIVNEVEGYWESRGENQDAKRYAQTVMGNQWAKYATGTVMAPIIFVLPFPTMVNVDEQYTQQMLHGGNFIRNFLGAFVLIAIYTALFVRKNWRNLSHIGSFALAYLGIISTSGFANSERFLLPALPLLLIMAAYGITELNAKNYRFVKTWYYVVPIMSIAWAYFKLGSRGIL